MAGNTVGGKKSYETTLKKLGSEFIKERNSKAGRAGKTGGFYGNPKLASEASKTSWRIRRARAVEKSIDT